MMPSATESTLEFAELWRRNSQLQKLNPAATLLSYNKKGEGRLQKDVILTQIYKAISRLCFVNYRREIQLLRNKSSNNLL